MSFTVAIDGPAASGKGTISRAVAEHFGLGHLDTGLLYRAVGKRMLQGETPESAAVALTADDLAEPDTLRGPDVAQAASKVAAIPEVRAALVDFQRAFARRAGGAVLDGRDIGTVICPNAEAKLFVTAHAAKCAPAGACGIEGAGSRDELTRRSSPMSMNATHATGRSSAPAAPGPRCGADRHQRSGIEDAIAAAIRAVEAKRF
jgi:cytidylate kinase